MSAYCILIPVYNDWVSLQRLLIEIDQHIAEAGVTPSVLLIDDGSPILPPDDLIPAEVTHLDAIYMGRLSRNMGHQRAIAVGMVHASEILPDHHLIIMDSDGEDKPSDLPQLIAAHREATNAIIVAGRHRRSEGRIFQLFYMIYRWLFVLLSGVQINFGNYCLIPARHVESLIYDPNLWNHLAATIRRSKIPLTEVKTNRGNRYAGQSSMNFTSLVLHGLSAVSVYLDLVVVRILIFSSLIGFVSLIGIGVVVFLRLFTTTAIPGWATTAVGILTIIMSQAILFSAVAAIAILNQRSRLLIIPARHAFDLLTVHSTVLKSPKIPT